MTDQMRRLPHEPVLDVLAGVTVCPAAVWLGDAAAVVLARTDDGLEIWQDGVVTSYAADTPIVPLADLRQQQAMLHTALTSLNQLRHRVLRDLATQADRQMSTLDSIRAYAVDAHEAGDICEDGLDRFLDRFGFDPYRL